MFSFNFIEPVRPVPKSLVPVKPAPCILEPVKPVLKLIFLCAGFSSFSSLDYLRNQI